MWWERDRSRARLLREMHGKILARGHLTGLFERN
jgi:phosphatidylethanolamine-binding protein (PEBP) family uncharacterized protein